MRKHFKTLTLTILLIALLATASGMLLACNKKIELVDKRRVASDNVVSTVLSTMNAGWKPGFSDEKLSYRADSGDYIIAVTWLNAVGDILYASKLQTSKLQNIARELTSENGKRILSGHASVTVKDYVLLFDAFGFTTIDVSNLLFDVISVLPRKINGAIDVAKNRMDTVRILAHDDGNFDGMKNIDTALTSVFIMKSSITKLVDNSEEIVAAMNDTRPTMDAFISTFYNLSFQSNIMDMLDELSSGAFENISEREIKIYIDGMQAEIKNLKKILTVDETAKMTKVLKLLVDSFKGVILPSNLFKQISSVVSTANVILDYVPDLCDLMVNMTSCITPDMIKMAQDYSKSVKAENEAERMSTMNSGIFVAKFLKSALGVSDENFPVDTPEYKNEKERVEDSLYSLISRVANKAGKDYEKLSPLVSLNVGMTFILWQTVDSYRTPAVEEFFKKEWAIVYASASLRTCKAEFGVLLSLGGNGGKFDNAKGVLLAYLGRSETPPKWTDKKEMQRWFNTLVYNVEQKLAKDSVAIKAEMITDTKKCIGIAFDMKYDMLLEYANMPLVAAGGDVARLRELYNGLGIEFILNALGGTPIPLPPELLPNSIS